RRPPGAKGKAPGRARAPSSAGGRPAWLNPSRREMRGAKVILWSAARLASVLSECGRLDAALGCFGFVFGPTAPLTPRKAARSKPPKAASSRPHSEEKSRGVLRPDNFTPEGQTARADTPSAPGCPVEGPTHQRQSKTPRRLGVVRVAPRVRPGSVL